MPRAVLLTTVCVSMVIGLLNDHPLRAESPAKNDAKKTLGKIERFDAEFDALLPEDAKLEILADGLEWSEGPVWISKTKSLLFSDIPRNQINQWNDRDGLSVFMSRSGYTGKASFTGAEPGTNGLILDSKGRLVMCCHGDRCIKRVEADGSLTVLVSHYQDKRLNSPNDLVYHSTGDLYFTDPPFGLPKRHDDPARELDYCGVYRLTSNGKLHLLTQEFVSPNGIGLSPDEKTLYVAQSGRDDPHWRAFPVQATGMLGEGRLVRSAKDWIGKVPGSCDGFAVDQQGRLWATGPGGVWIINTQGKLIGRLYTGERTANCTFGEDGKTLFITADMYLCRIRTNVTGVGF